MFEKLKYKSNIKFFFIVISSIILLGIMLRITLTNTWLPTDQNKISHLAQYFLEIIDKFVISLVITVGVAAFIFYLTKDDPDHDVIILDSDDIGGAIKKTMRSTNHWCFNGASGSFTRSTTLPFLAKIASQKNVTIPVQILLMNPQNVELCQKYAKYRNSLDIDIKFKGKTIKSVQLDIIATIITCYCLKEEQPRLDIKIGLKDYFSILRTDISSDLAIITKENPKDVALIYKKNSVFYNAQFEEINHLLNQLNSFEVNIEFTTKELISIESIKELLLKLKLNLDFSDEEYNQLINIIKSSKNPYGK